MRFLWKMWGEGSGLAYAPSSPASRELPPRGKRARRTFIQIGHPGTKIRNKRLPSSTTAQPSASRNIHGVQGPQPLVWEGVRDSQGSRGNLNVPPDPWALAERAALPANHKEEYIFHSPMENHFLVLSLRLRCVCGFWISAVLSPLSLNSSSRSLAAFSKFRSLAAESI